MSDSGCGWTRHIVVDDGQRAAMKAAPTVWRSLAEQILAHNDERAKRCG